jgi:hypothetical protein
LYQTDWGLPEAEYGEAGPAGRAPPQEGNPQLSGCRGFTRFVEKPINRSLPKTYIFFRDKKIYINNCRLMVKKFWTASSCDIFKKI